MALASATALLAWASPAAYADVGSYVTGGGAGFIPKDSPAFPGDRVQLELVARTLPSGKVSGQFNVVHHSAGGGVFAHLEGYVDCLSVSDSVAIIAGVTGHAIAPCTSDPVLSFTVTQGDFRVG